MNILMIMVKEFGPGRAKKASRVLVDEGHKVTVLVRNRRGEPLKETVEGVMIERLPYLKWFGKLSRSITHFVSIPVFFNPLYVYYVVSRTITTRTDVLHVHDLPMMPLAIFLGWLLRIPVIFDLHEHYPAMAEIGGSMGKTQGFLQKFYRRTAILRRIEKFSLKYADRVLVVCNEQRDRISNMGITSAKILVIGNTVVLEEFGDANLSVPSENRNSEGFVLLYTGAFGYNRGLETVIEAMPQIVERLPHCRLILVGDGPVKPHLMNLVETLGIQSNVVFAGWVSYTDFPDYINSADLCIIPHLSDEHINTTYPKKMFEFMCMGKPLIVSDAKPLKRIVVDEAQAGIAFASGDPESFAKAVITFYERPELQDQMGIRARNIVLEKYNWDIDAEKIRLLYSNLE